MANSKAAPLSYKDPFWSNLAGIQERKYKLPKGLLKSIILNGERTPNDVVSPAGARTVFQITPATRNAVMKKYGIDAYASPQDAAAAAAVLLRESLDRNGGDVTKAVREYHGGTNPKNWGPINDAYVARVLGGSQDTGSQKNYKFSVPKPYQPEITQPPKISTYDQVQAQFHQDTAPAISKVYDAYKSGKMSASDAKQFEEDVSSGAIVLPDGATLKNGKSTGAIWIPQSVADAMYEGKLDPESLKALQEDKAAGLIHIPVPTKLQSNLPNFDSNGTIIPEPTEQQNVIQPKPQPTFADKVVGAAEAATTLGTGMTTGAIGQLGGTASGLTQSILNGTFGTPQGAEQISQSAAQGAQALTYAPRTSTGQSYADATAQFLEPLQALTPAAAELGAVAGAARATRPLAEGAVAYGGQQVGKAASAVADATRNTVGKAVDNIKTKAGDVAEGLGLKQPQERTYNPTTNTFNDGSQLDTGTPNAGSMGAAGVPDSQVRTALATELPYPIERMTVGQITRNPDLLKQEVETSKTPQGAAYRALAEENTAKIHHNMDAFNDMTGAQLPDDLYLIGKKVDEALVKEFEKDKAKTLAKYTIANNSEEAQTPVDMSQPVSGTAPDKPTLIDYLNNTVEGATENIIPTARKLAVHHGLAIKDLDGKLLPAKPTLKQVEEFRKDINAKTDAKEDADVRQANIIKNYVDEHTAPFEGHLYKDARAARTAQYKKWESSAAVADLMSLKENGKLDRKVPFENIVKKVVYGGSQDDLRKVKRTLLTSGEDGKQAWKEIQGAVIREIHDNASKGIAPDAQGQQMISPSKLDAQIRFLDKSGKLDYLFGKQGAEQLRALNQVAKDLFTVPVSSAINHSNTASALQVVGESIASFAITGLPLPVVTALKQAVSHIKDAKVRKRVSDSIIKLEAPQRQTGNF